MTTINTSGRPGYMYDEATTTWYAISGRVSTSANYVWTGAQQFDNNSIFGGAITAKLKFNCFLNPAARTTAIPSPGTGLLTFIQQDGSGNTLNRFEYWDGSAWVAYADPATTVTLAGTQTLTNKTLTSPAINGASLSGTLSGSPTLSGTVTLSGTISGGTVDSAYLISPSEKMTVSATAATGTINYNVITQGSLYYTTAASGNFTLNFRGDGSTTLNSIMAAGESYTVTFLNTNGSPAYYANAFQVDGTSVTPKWQYGSAPSSGNVNAVDAYTFTIIKTASATFTVLASLANFS